MYIEIIMFRLACIYQAPRFKKKVLVNSYYFEKINFYIYKNMNSYLDKHIFATY